MTDDANRVSRRRLLAASAGGTLAGLAASTAATAQTADPSTPINAETLGQCQTLIRKAKLLTMATAWPRGTPLLDSAANFLAQQVKVLSGGKLSIQLFFAGELVPVSQSYAAAQSRTVDMLYSFESYRAIEQPGFHAFSAIPFGMTDTETMAWLQSEGLRLWESLSAPSRLKPFWAGFLGQQLGPWLLKPWDKEQGFSGWRVRANGLSALVYRALGAEAITLDQAGLEAVKNDPEVHGIEWFCAATDQALGLHNARSHVLSPSLNRPSQQVSVLVNLDTWDALEPDHKAILAMTIGQTGHILWGNAEAQNRIILSQLVQQGLELHSLSDAQANAMGQAASNTLVELFGQNAAATEVLRSYARFRQAALALDERGHAEFQRARLLPFQFPS